MVAMWNGVWVWVCLNCSEFGGLFVIFGWGWWLVVGGGKWVWMVDGGGGSWWLVVGDFGK
jgi:hypothetical protein